MFGNISLMGVLHFLFSAITVFNCVAFVTLFSKMWVCTNYEIRKRVQLGNWLLMATVRI